MTFVTTGHWPFAGLMRFQGMKKAPFKPFWHVSAKYNPKEKRNDMSNNSFITYAKSPAPPPAKSGPRKSDSIPKDKTTIGFFDGHFDYPSSAGLGIDTVNYSRRNPHPTEHDPLPIKIKMKDLPHSIIRDLKDAARAGELREELHRHIDLLERNQYADKSTIQLLKSYQLDLTGHAGCDADQLDTICEVIGTCGPTGA